MAFTSNSNKMVLKLPSKFFLSKSKNTKREFGSLDFYHLILPEALIHFEFGSIYFPSIFEMEAMTDALGVASGGVWSGEVWVKGLTKAEVHLTGLVLSQASLLSVYKHVLSQMALEVS